jgi:hypothetical protein
MIEEEVNRLLTKRLPLSFKNGQFLILNNNIK